MPLRSKTASFLRRSPLHMAALLVSLAMFGGCDRLKQALKDESATSEADSDPVWQGDSTMLASKPSILFRIVDHEKGRAAAPIATIGSQGFRRLTMGRRGWRALDLNYLQAGSTLTALRDGRPAGDARVTRGMWEAGTQLDSLPGCPTIVPVGLVDVAPGVMLASAGPKPVLNPVTPLSDGELQAALSTIPTLIAPSSGIATSVLSRYKREVHVMATGIGARPSILVAYNDPEQVSDTLSPMAQRPRQFIVVLDKGVYGYRPTFTYTTLGNAITPPRYTFLDYVDVNSDGKAELLFGVKLNKQYDVTVVMRFENDTWREVLRELVRCQVNINRARG